MDCFVKHILGLKVIVSDINEIWSLDLAYVDKGTEFNGEFENLCTKREIIKYNTHSEKKSAFAERNIRSLKSIIYKYLEFEWTYSYIENYKVLFTRLTHALIE